MDLSLFEHNADSYPIAKAVGWDEFAAAMGNPLPAQCTLATCQHKNCAHKNGLAWSPAVYKAGTTRGVEGVDYVSALVVDLDDIPPSELEGIRNRLSGLQYLIHASHSDRPHSRRLRLIVATDTPIPAKEFGRFWKAANQALGLPGDKQTSDSSRLYYLPSRPQGADYYYERSTGGFPLAVERVMAMAPVPAPAPNISATLPPSFHKLTAEGIEQALNTLAAGWPRKQRHAAGLALAGALAKSGWPAEHIARFVTEVGRRNALITRYNELPYEQEYAKRLEQAQASVFKIAQGEVITGWGALTEFVDPKAIDNTRKALGQYDTALIDAIAATAPDLPPELEPGAPDKAPAFAIKLSDVAAIGIPDVRTYRTGIDELDDKLGGGIATRQITTICAPPAAGKSGLAIEIEIEIQKVIPVLKISTELESSELLARYASNLKGFAWRDAVRGKIDKGLIATAVADLNIFVAGVDKLPSSSAEALTLIRRTIMLLTEQYGVPPLVMIDYLQDLVPASEENQKGAVGSMARELLKTAQYLDCPVVVISSVSRAWYSPEKAEKMRKSNDPSEYISAAKESGGVDFASATIIFVDVDHTEVMTEGYKIARLALAKVRHGEIGFVGCRFYGATGRWVGDRVAGHIISTGAKSAEKALARAREHEERVYAVATRQPLPRTTLRDVCGLNKKAADEAITALLEAGRLTMIDYKINQADGRTKTVKAVAIAGYQAAPVFDAPPASAPDSSLASVFAHGKREYPGL